MRFERHHSVPVVLVTSPRGRIRHLVFISLSHRDTYFQFTISHWLLSLRSVVSGCHIAEDISNENELPSSPREIATSYLLREVELPPSPWKFLPYLPNQTHSDPGIRTQQRYSHIHTTHQESHGFIQGNFAYLALICALWSGRGLAGKKVSAVSFFRCPTLHISAYCQCINNGYINIKLTRWCGRHF